MKLFRWTVVLLVAYATIGLAGQPAFAQDATGQDVEQPTMQEDIDSFWASRRHVRVLQRRLYETAGDFQFTLALGAIPNDPFLKYFPMGGRFGYHVSESIALELSGAYNVQSQTDLADFLDQTGDVDVFLRDEQLWRANIAALWSPIYGKFSFLGTKLAHFDWFFVAGFGVVQTRSPEEGFLGVRHINEIKPEAVLGTGWNLHLSQRFALRWDYRQFIFQKEAGGVALPSELSLGASFFF